MTVYISRDDSDALAHYGVMGMKWGVRHDRARGGNGRETFDRAMDYVAKRESRAAKYDQKAARHLKPEKAYKAKLKATKYQARASKWQRRAGSARWNPFRSTTKSYSKALKYQAKADKWKMKETGATAKYTKYSQKALKQRAKAEKMVAAVNREYENVSFKDISPKYKNLGKKYYLDMLG